MALVRIGVSEECNTSIIRVKRFSGLLKSEFLTRSIWHHIPEEGIFYLENVCLRTLLSIC
jgi:hypothetical protein